jgi:serine/threonine-protein phosphatase 2A activator
MSGYWADSFGNVVRIDYGTGHETTFAALLFCLAKLGALSEACLPAVVAKTFVKYLDLMRRMQTTYWYAPPPRRLRHMHHLLKMMYRGGRHD